MSTYTCRFTSVRSLTALFRSAADRNFRCHFKLHLFFGRKHLNIILSPSINLYSRDRGATLGLRGGGGGDGGFISDSIWGNSRYFFLLTLYNFENNWRPVLPTPLALPLSGLCINSNSQGFQKKVSRVASVVYYPCFQRLFSSQMLKTQLHKMLLLFHNMCMNRFFGHLICDKTLFFSTTVLQKAGNGSLLFVH